jgi:hypothetical protein
MACECQLGMQRCCNNELVRTVVALVVVVVCALSAGDGDGQHGPNTLHSKCRCPSPSGVFVKPLVVLLAAPQLLCVSHGGFGDRAMAPAHAGGRGRIDFCEKGVGALRGQAIDFRQQGYDGGVDLLVRAAVS